MYRVVLMDCEPIILQGLLKAFPWQEYDCAVVGTAMDGTEGLSIIRKHKPHIVLMDIRRPNADSLTRIAGLKSEFPHIQVTVLTAFRDFDYARQAMHLGVCRYLLKPGKMDELQEAFRHMTGMLSQRSSI